MTNKNIRSGFAVKCGNPQIIKYSKL